MIELVIGVLVFFSTLLLCLSVDVLLSKNRGSAPTHIVRPTNVDVDLTGFDVPSEDVDLNLRNSRGRERSVSSELDLIREMQALPVTEVDFDFGEIEEALGES